MRKFISGIAAMAAGLLIAAAFPLSAFAAAMVTVTPDNPDGWAVNPDGTTDGTVNYSTQFGAPQNLGQGALVVTTNSSASKIQYFHAANNVPLTNLDVSYNTYRPVGSTAAPGQVAALNMVIDYNGSAAGGYDTLVFEPIYQTDAQQIQSGTWQSWNAGNSGIWWSTRSIPGVCANTCYMTLASIAAANQSAVVQAFGVNQGSGNADLTSGVDGITFNGWEYNFEPYLVANSKSDCKNNGYQNVRDSYGDVFKNQGACVSWIEHNVNGNGNGNQNNQGQVQGASTTNNASNSQPASQNNSQSTTPNSSQSTDQTNGQSSTQTGTY